MGSKLQRFEADEASRGLWRYLPLAAVLIALIAVFAAGLHRSMTFESLVRHHLWLRQLVAERFLAMLGLYMLVYVAFVTLSIPASALLTALGGYLFGWAVGGSAASVAATLGATSIFLIARTSLGGSLLRLVGSRIRTLAAGFRREAFSYLLFLRLMPVVPFWVTNLAAAFFGVRIKTFVAATQIGMIPVSFAFAIAGSGLDEVIAQQEQTYRQCQAAGGAGCRIDFRLENLLTVELMIALAVLGILALAPILVRRWQARHQEEQM